MTIANEADIQAAYQGEEVAQKYVSQRFVSELHRLLHLQQVRAVQNVIECKRPQKTLEVAPGPGRLTRDVKTSGELVCLEFNSGMIAEGKRHCDPSVRWIQGNAFELPFGQEFDFIYSFRFVRHFHRSDRDRLYAQFRQVLNPGGWMVLDAVNAVVSLPLRDKSPEKYPIYDKLYRDENELRDELKDAGFDVLTATPVQRWFHRQYQADILLTPRSRLLSRCIVHLLEKLSRGPGLEWVVTCRLA